MKTTEQKKFRRRLKGKKPILAICYDFDKTLSPDNMQAQGYIQSVGYDVEDFWTECNTLSQDKDMDQNLAYMFMMKEKADGEVLFTRKNLLDYGSRITLFPGVEDWFDRINQYGKEHGVLVEHYIISSGLKEMIEGTPIAKKFERIFASSFHYNEKDVAIWPAQVVNFTNKTQFLFRIEKGVLDVNDPAVNEFFPPEKIRIPFRNIVYIGDSDTDIPCMKLVNVKGGHAIGVYNARTNDKEKVYKMMREERIKYFVPADYSEGREMDALLKMIIDKTAAYEKLENQYYSCKKEFENADESKDRTQRDKANAIIMLENSKNFFTTHNVIEELKKFDSWSVAEREKLCKIAVKNNQVGCIIHDSGVEEFYTNLVQDADEKDHYSQQVKKMLDRKN